MDACGAGKVRGQISWLDKGARRSPKQMAEMPEREDQQAGGGFKKDAPPQSAQAAAGIGKFVGRTACFRIESGVLYDEAGGTALVHRKRYWFNLRTLNDSD
jgi:hypothetical protein